MATLRVAMLQMAGKGIDLPARIDKATRFCKQAKEQGADIALMPEMWQIAYTGYDHTSKTEQDKWKSQAAPEDGEYVQHFRNLARELDMAIVATYLQQWPGLPRNAATLIDRHGQVRMTYAKVHTCDFQEMEAICTPGDDFYVTDLDTKAGHVRVGMMICYDREFPESARVLMLKDAELVLIPNACTIDHLRIAQLTSRAYENAMALAMTNYAMPQHNGHSVAFDATGEMILDAGENEGVFVAELDLDTLHAHRAKTIWGNAYRRPHRYSLLASTQVSPHFVRRNKFGDVFNREKR